jgi:hypothetical protein
MSVARELVPFIVQGLKQTHAQIPSLEMRCSIGFPFYFISTSEGGQVKMRVRPIGSGRSYGEDVNARKEFSAKFLINHNKRLGSYVLKYFYFNWGNLVSSYVMFFY